MTQAKKDLQTVVMFLSVGAAIAAAVYLWPQIALQVVTAVTALLFFALLLSGAAKISGGGR